MKDLAGSEWEATAGERVRLAGFVLLCLWEGLLEELLNRVKRPRPAV